MNCAFCLEPMNDGATACKTCGRKQPAGEQTVTWRWKIAGVTLLALGAGVALAWFLNAAAQRQQAMNDVRRAAQFCGGKNFTPEAAQKLVEVAHDGGVSWDGASHIVRVWIGC
jgi:hypothetical protein